MKTLTFAVVCLSCLAGTGIYGQDIRAVTEFDPGLSVAVELNPRIRLDFATGREKSEELASTKWKVSGGASFRLRPIFKAFLNAVDSDRQHLLVIGSAYEFSRTSEAAITKTEHKVMLDGTARYAFAQKLLMSDRNRIEFRWINGDYHWRYRNRLMFERPVRIKKLRISPYGAAEAFWDHRYRKWSIFKFTGGVQLPFIRRSTLDLYYERQRCVTCSDPNTNIFGATVNLSFRLKKT